MSKVLAQKYVKKGYPIVPVPHGQKSPIIKNWPDLVVTQENLGEYFPEGQPRNIAMALGKDGSKFVDLDIDDPAALFFGKLFAPKTGMIYGRKSKPCSHYVYKFSDDVAKTKSFKTSDGVMIEVLGEGHLCNLPGSLHPTGEVYEFDAEGEPAEVHYNDLLKAAALIATCCLMTREWPAKGGRNDMALSLSGALCKAGYEPADVMAAIFHVAKKAGDEEADKRRITAKDTIKRYRAGKAIKGFSGLKECLLPEAYTCLENWLGISADDEIEEIVQALNDKYAFIIVGGKQRILVENKNPNNQLSEVDFQTVDAFKGFHKNRKICVGHSNRGPIYKSHAEVWLEHPQRRSYEGMTFEPGKEITGGIFNYYRGLGIKPAESLDFSKCQRFLEHWHQVVCAGDDDIFDWVLAWFADAVQNPGQKPGTAIVLTGPQGCGKSCAVEYAKSIFEPHFLKISDKSHLYGKFNAHQQGVLLMLCEEISIASDKKVMGIVKDMITSDHMMIERKGLDAVSGRNCLRLIITSNEQIVIPADMDDRRFLVLDVSGEYANDFEYFEQLIEEGKSGGAASLLNFLLQLDYSGINLRKPPQTKAMMLQKIGGLEPVAKALYTFLLNGHIHPESSEWPQWIATQQFQNICLKTIKLDGLTPKGIQTKIGTELQKYIGPVEKPKQTLPKVDEDTGLPYNPTFGGNACQQLVYLLPSLQECRKRFTAKTGITFPEEE